MKFQIKKTTVNYFTILFGAASLVFWGFLYDQHLFRLEQLQLFEVTGKYLANHLSVQGGFSIWVAEFLTQFFRVPLAGAIIIASMLLLLRYLTLSLLNDKQEKNIYSFIPSAFYWVLLTTDYYSLSGLVGMIISLAFVRIFLVRSPRNLKLLAWLIFIPVAWWLTGAGYIIYSLCTVTLVITEKDFKKISNGQLNSVIFIFLVILVSALLPLLACKYFLDDTILQAFVSEAYYQVRIMFPVPLIVLLALFPLFIFRGKFRPVRPALLKHPLAEIAAGLVYFFIIAILVIHTGGLKLEREIRYDNLVYQKRWDKIIRIAERKTPEDRLSLCAVNLALAKTGRLSDKIFHFRQNPDCLFPGYDRNGMTPFLANEPFYYMGFNNFAQYLTLETIESTIDSRFPSRSFKRAAETFIINGQYDNARKYLIPLSHTLFMRRWAKDCLESLGREDQINSHIEWRELRQNQPKIDFFYNDNQKDRAMQMLLQTDPRNKVAFEYLMAYYLLTKNFDGFLYNIHLVNNMNYPEMPLAFQEAAVFINSVSPSTPPQLQNFPVKNSVLADFRSFSALSETQGKKTDESAFRDYKNTYWYYILFR